LSQRAGNSAKNIPPIHNGNDFIVKTFREKGSSGVHVTSLPGGPFKTFVLIDDERSKFDLEAERDLHILRRGSGVRRKRTKRLLELIVRLTINQPQGKWL